MDKYKRLLSNTVIIAIGTFSSKVLVFLLMPLYTRVLTNAEYGDSDLILQTGNLLLPLVTMGMIEGVVRFGLDRRVRKTDVFSTGVGCTLIGFLVLLVFEPLITRIDFISPYTLLIYVFVLCSSLRTLSAQFVRATGNVRLYAVNGILSTAFTIGFNVLFLVGLKMGVRGYLLAIICADALSTIFLFWRAKLYRYVRFRGLRLYTTGSMLRYSIPMIPTTLLWWITNVSDRYIVTYMSGSDANGLYAVAYKIPSIIVLVCTIFLDAWQISAVTEEQARARFFTKVFRSYTALVFLVSSVVILFCKIIIRILVSPEFYEAWKYVPFLILATVFNCLVSFLGSVYMVEKKSVRSLMTAAAGAALNIGLNFLLIPKYGPNGAGFATFLSYFLVYLLRARDATKFVKIRWSHLKMMVNSALITAQCFVVVMEVQNWLVYEIALVGLIVIINVKEVLQNVQKILSSTLKRRQRRV